jgi:proline-specific peptidase
MHATVNGTRLFYLPVGAEENYPLFALHGGPGLDHTELHPWLDPLGDTFRLIYVDMRGQGRSERVDPASLSLEGFAADVSGLAAALGLERYALLGHSYGAFVALTHAIERGEASHYVITSGSASMKKSMPEIEANLASFEPVELREQVTQSWALEPSAATQEDFAKMMAMQMPFHFASVESEGYRRFLEAGDRSVYAPEVLRHFSAAGYSIEYEDRLGSVDKPVLIITGEHDRTCTPRAAREMHACIPNSELAIISNAGHMSFIEQPDAYFSAVRSFFARHGGPA